MTRILDNYCRVNRHHLCPICGRHDWCLVDRENPADPRRVICARVESADRHGDAGWLHIMRRIRSRPSRPFVRSVTTTSTLNAQLYEMSEQFRGGVDLERLQRLADDLGLSTWSLMQLGVGWAGSSWSFPMRDERGNVIGIRLRISGGKFAIRGSRNGLFFAPAIGVTNRLFVAEGESDTAALMDLGFATIGRPGCDACSGLVVKFVKLHGVQEVILAADADEPGQHGAARLGRALRLHVRDVRVITPPDGIKDVREWKRRGAQRIDIERGRAASRPIGLIVRADTRGQ